ncbi:hypothetical protein [Bacillus sp. FJAT-22090]|uniref:hypothetical protein n=1 Tax=Bacillus sp. FJAT-22090 TaxID=1581038 RepID=UPI0011A7E6D4|nr:hypothetical protein [Bacillus sp. FJAT-22090]
MSKEININGKNLFEVEIDNVNDPFHVCTIENVGRDEYHAYNDRGEGYSIVQLDTVDIVELLTTGRIDRNSLTIKHI